ncbi:MAG: indolepyruvate oxidoreductase subunit beta [Candidatus Cloacimonetes bacterium]|nr:indolepyruvate oxidoreductase subunit beta [Candidatus Cloacimonadota bacterium]
MKKDKINVLICGVGGQGILLASEILSEVLIKAGYDVKKSEVHGMSQRGGSVESHVRAGKKVYSPLIKKGEADFILSFESMEGLRHLEYLAPDGKLIRNTQKIIPLTVTIGNAKYPENPEELAKENGIETISINAIKIAKELGSDKVVNIILLGILAQYLGIDREIWNKVITDWMNVKKLSPKIMEINKKAFERGFTT